MQKIIIKLLITITIVLFSSCAFAEEINQTVRNIEASVNDGYSNWLDCARNSLKQNPVNQNSLNNKELNTQEIIVDIRNAQNNILDRNTNTISNNESQPLKNSKEVPAGQHGFAF